MKLLLVLILFLSFADCPTVMMTLDNSHSVALANEHGVYHLVFSHVLDSCEKTQSGLFSAGAKEDNHEFCLSTSAAIVHKTLQFSSLTSDVTSQNDHTIVPKTTGNLSENPFEPDIGAFHRPSHVLRI